MSSQPKTQTALLVPTIGSRLTLHTTHPIPFPSPSQIQIRTTLAGLNPHDQKSRDRGLFIKDHLPGILSNDIVGVVTALGSNASKYAIGDRIFAQSKIVNGNEQKGFQEFAVLDEQFSSKVPEGMRDTEVGTLPTNALAALVAIFDGTGLGIPAPWLEEAKTFDYKGTTLLVVGGGANCGKFGVQFAKLAGIGKIVVVGGEEAELKRLGATHVLDRHGGDEVVGKRIREVVGDELIYAFDVVNGLVGQHIAVSALSTSKKGTLARLVFSVGSLNEGKIMPEKKAGYELRNVFGSSHDRPELAKGLWDRVGEYLRGGKLVPLKAEVVEGLDVDKANEVLDRYRDGKKVIQTHFRISN
ncbi:putative alcohol dehydrogenase [Clohesyomyces aquaticus]|uniref:Putative alcohol dehydrogenase n=1 Tax=Clohesyomyces aquaticus TaxID=1231657 RepID=A0A1Y2A161_9PLEO|nr:putative alcohol dehydrogenase [Clohesyomyces aquaticus]